MEGGAEELDFFGHDSGVVGGEDGGGDDEGVSGVGPVVESPSANDVRVRRCFHRRVYLNTAVLICSSQKSYSLGSLEAMMSNLCWANC